MSNEIITEYEKIIKRRLGIENTDAMLRYLLMRPNVGHIEPTYRWRLLKDEDDNKFVDCAVAANRITSFLMIKGFESWLL